MWPVTRGMDGSIKRFGLISQSGWLCRLSLSLFLSLSLSGSLKTSLNIQGWFGRQRISWKIMCIRSESAPFIAWRYSMTFTLPVDIFLLAWVRVWDLIIEQYYTTTASLALACFVRFAWIFLGKSFSCGVGLLERPSELVKPLPGSLWGQHLSEVCNCFQSCPRWRLGTPVLYLVIDMVRSPWSNTHLSCIHDNWI